MTAHFTHVVHNLLIHSVIYGLEHPGKLVCDSRTYKALYLSCLGAKDTTQSL